MSETAIRVNGLSKAYQIYSKPSDRLRQFIWPRLSDWVGLPSRQYYRDFWALKDVSFEVKRGETVGIIGRNGSGKSTLLQMICGTLTPTQGQVQTNGRVAALLELGSGFNLEFTGRENVYLNAAVLGLTKTQIDERYEAILDFADIGEFIERPVKTYSSGMLVRLAFAVIAHVDADILVIDEALAVGDVFFTQKCTGFLREFQERGTVLLVTHDTNSVMAMCSRALWLSKGCTQLLADSKRVCEAYLGDLYNLEVDIKQASPKSNSDTLTAHKENLVDCRREWINSTILRNDLELQPFDISGTQFGDGLAQINEVSLRNEEGNPMAWCVGGECVRLRIKALALADLKSVIIGFLIKDKLGQHLFGDNTFLRYADQPCNVSSQDTIASEFAFRMPVLPSGEYTLGVAVASGTQLKHEIHHWLHDALVIKSHSSSVSTGLIGIPMHQIFLAREATESSELC